MQLSASIDENLISNIDKNFRHLKISQNNGQKQRIPLSNQSINNQITIHQTSQIGNQLNFQQQSQQTQTTVNHDLILDLNNSLKMIDKRLKELEQTKMKPPAFTPLYQFDHCIRCLDKFGFFSFRINCNGCGKVMCSSCCNMYARMPLMYGSVEKKRCCTKCFELHNNGKK